MKRKGCLNFTLSGYLMVLPLVLGTSPVIPRGPQKLLSTEATCVNRCTCNNTAVACVALRLRRIPSGISPETTSLDLSFNRISHIHVQSLSQLPKLRRLSLRGNQIALIPDEMRLSLPKLKVLDLSLNLVACRCPLKWLQGALSRGPTHWDIDLVSDKQTHCGKYRDIIGRRPPSIDTCLVRSRHRRTPSCENIPCQHGRCYTDPVRCVCYPPYYGSYCDEYDRSMTPSNGDIHITIERTTPNSVAISWEIEFDDVTFFVNVTMMTERGRIQVQGSRTSAKSLLLENMRPATNYTICVTADGPLNGHMGCINITTPRFNSTLAPTWEANSPGIRIDQGEDHGGDQEGGSGILDAGYNNGYDPENRPGSRIEYAFISLTSLFGICLFLTVLVGFVYYKRVHGIVSEEPAARDPEAPADNQQGVVVVSTGNEIIYNRGAVNRAFNPDDTQQGDVAASASNPRRPRSVRFNLQSKHSQDSLEGDVPTGIPFTITGHGFAASRVVQNRGAVNISGHGAEVAEHIPLNSETEL